MIATPKGPPRVAALHAYTSSLFGRTGGIFASASLASILLLVGCSAPEAATLADIADLADLLDRDYGLEIAATDDVWGMLQWQLPGACEQVYRIRIDEQLPERYMRATHLKEEHSEAFLVLARDPAQPESQPIARGQTLYHRPGKKNQNATKELLLSAKMLGPGSPDAACYERTWNPTEDALTLGWPGLPGRVTAVGETWVGNPVEARCNRIACIDPETKGGGEAAHNLPCVTMSWREHLDGIYELGSQQVAAISSFWTDGHPLDVGVWTERTALVSTSGRLIHAHTTIHHNFLGVTRDITLDAVDACEGSLPAAGFDPPTTLKRAIASVRDQLPRTTRHAH
ncbi:MAG: hypothetical protein ACPG77_19365 [Nannocystaceae bacterium]